MNDDTDDLFYGLTADEYQEIDDLFHQYKDEMADGDYFDSMDEWIAVTTRFLELVKKIKWEPDNTQSTTRKQTIQHATKEHGKTITRTKKVKGFGSATSQRGRA